MKTIKKNTISGVLFATMILLVTGCSSSDKTNNVFSGLFSFETKKEKTSVVDTENVSSVEAPSSISEDFDSEAGGNPEQNTENASGEVDKFEITVSEDKYFVENHELSYDDLIEKIEELDEDDYVVLYDEKSTLKAFNKIKDYLEENKILYEVD